MNVLRHPPQAFLITTLACAALAGCTDTRITLDEFAQRQAAATPIQAVDLEPASFALTELQPYRVGPGDVLNVTLTGIDGAYSQQTLQLRVHDDGNITLPMVGSVHVANLDLKSIEKAIHDAHVPEFVKHLAVFAELGGPETTTVVVVGAAMDSGLIQLRRNERNVLYALARSAGFSSSASGRVTVRPVDPERDPLTFDLNDIHDLRRALVGPPLQSGDMIVVDAAEPSAIYVTGLVNSPGPIPIPRNGHMNLSRALAAAGGLRDFLEPDEATLWRELPTGEQVRVKVPLLDLFNGETTDVALNPGDLLDIPHTPKTRFREWVAANIKIGPFGVTAMYDPVADNRARILENDDDNLARRVFLQNLGAGAAELIVPTVP